MRKLNLFPFVVLPARIGLMLALATFTAGHSSLLAQEDLAQEDLAQEDLARENLGQADLDKATITKLSANSLADLEEVADLCDSAIAKGLDEKNAEYARDLLKSTLYEQADRLSRMIFDKQPVDRRWPQIRKMCLGKLQRALDVDPDLGSVHLLIARLNTLPGGDREAAKAALEKSIPTFESSPELLSVAYQVRASLTEDRDKALADLNRAIELYPRNLTAWRARGVHYMAGGEHEKALEDLQQLLERNPDDLMAHQAIAQTFRLLKQYDKASEHLDRVLKADPESSLAYNLKARIEEEQGNIDGALENLNAAIRNQSRDIGALLYRARLLAAQQQYDLARNDADQALKIRPGLPQAMLMRSVISAAQDRFGEAIGDLQTLLRRQPDNVELKIQIATFFEADQRPRSAIEIYTEIIEAHPDNWMVLRRRGDARLSIAEQANAIQDYEAAVAINSENADILNNLAWVLATSPDDQLRDGQRAVEFAQKACEITEFKSPHILSTLAAGHAELGDFDEAVRWSAKAVKLDGEEDQLAQELASYQAGKAWRELRDLEENAEKLKIPKSDESTTPVFDDVPDLDSLLDSETPEGTRGGVENEPSIEPEPTDASQKEESDESDR